MMFKIFAFLLLISYLIFPQSNLIKGVDLSFIPQVEDNGGSYKINNVETDPLEIFKQNGANFVRLRLWHTPVNGYCGLEHTIEMAKRIKEKGLKFLLDFHYSDTWADPGNQNKPAAWSSLGYNELSDSVYSYTFRVIKLLDTINALPDMVQIGNEITPGFLWPEGRIGGTFDSQWPQFTNLLKQGIQAVHDAASDTVKIMIHIDRGANNTTSRWFFDNLTSNGVNFDVIGQSFYPWWHGTLTQVKQNLNDLALRYNKEIVIAETAYPWTLQWYDNTNNLVGSSNQLHEGYPASVEGQYNYIYDVYQLIKDIPNNKGLGIFYWAPEWISTPTFGSSWENIAMFDFNGNTLNSMRVFTELETDTSDAINITFILNTSTNFDTLKTDAFVQLRGEVVGGADILADGKELTWDINSDIILQNLSGDYWYATARVTPNTEINYKFWTGHNSTKPTFLRVGWEGPIQPFDSSAGNFRKFIAGENDTVLTAEFYNSTGTTYNQNRKPYENKVDSVAVYLRVNMRGVTAEGRFNPQLNGPVGVRGENLNSSNMLSWDQTKFIMQRETLSVSGGSFWSASLYYPKTMSGLQQGYKFFIENDSDNGWENNISNRSFIVPEKDTTIYWVFFDDNNTITDVEEIEEIINSFNLYQNYPNPFNSSTEISYDLLENSDVNISVYNLIGERVNDIVNKNQNPGHHNIRWNGKDDSGNDLTSGIYFIKMKADSFNKTIKAILLR